MTPALAFGALTLAAVGLIVLNATGRADGPPQASAGPTTVATRTRAGSSGAGPVGAVGAPSPRIVYVTAPVASPPAPHPSAPSAPPPRPSASSSTNPAPSVSGSSSTEAVVVAAAVRLSPPVGAGPGIRLRLVVHGVLAVP